MTRRPAAQRIAEYLIRRACRLLPSDIRDDRYREWAAEFPAILHDPDIRFALLRTARALRYAAGTGRSARRLHRAAGRPRQGTLVPAILPRPDGVLPVIAGVIAWLCLVVLIHAYPPHGSWNYLVAAAGVAAGVLVVVGEIRFILWVRRRSRRTPPPGA